MTGTKLEIRYWAVALAMVFAASLVTSLFFKEKWLWMDEVLSYQLVADPSLAHLNKAIVSGMDANPPLFPNLYWAIGHGISLTPQFLRSVSIGFFAITLALFYVYTTRLIGTPRTNLVLVSLIVAFTYLNFTLATQIRGYAVFFLVSCAYFVAVHQLVLSPRKIGLFVAHVLIGILLVLNHNFGLFYLAASGGFVALLYGWGRERGHLWVLGSHLVIALTWFLLWYPSFAIQAEAGKPHSWIPLPTWRSFFLIAGELVPSVSSRLERSSFFIFLPILRFLVVLGLFVFIAVPRLRKGFRQTMSDHAFVFYLFAGITYFSTLAVSVLVSFLHTSVFISRYLWPSHLLLVFQFVYAYYHFVPARAGPERDESGLSLGGSIRAAITRSRGVIVIYLIGVGIFAFLQNRKIVVFPHGIVPYLANLNPSHPVFVETADYFLPLWFHRKEIPVRYVLDWESASRPGNLLGATVEHKILQSFSENYHAPEIVPLAQFTAEAFPHFYVVDEDSVYAIERFLETGRVRVVGQLPVTIAGHRLLECAFEPSIAGVGASARRLVESSSQPPGTEGGHLYLHE